MLNSVFKVEHNWCGEFWQCVSSHPSREKAEIYVSRKGPTYTGELRIREENGCTYPVQRLTKNGWGIINTFGCLTGVEEYIRRDESKYPGELTIRKAEPKTTYKLEMRSLGGWIYVKSFSSREDSERYAVQERSIHPSSFRILEEEETRSPTMRDFYVAKKTPHPLDDVFKAVIDQVTKGKGERHGGEAVPFYEQPWFTIASQTGWRGLVFQALKKAGEACGKSDQESFERELLGAIAYLGMAYLFVKKEGFK